MFQHENTSQLLGNQVTSNHGVHVAGASFAHKADNTLDTLDNTKSEQSDVHDNKEESSSKIATAFSAQPSHKQEEPTRYDSVELDNGPNRIDDKGSKPSLIDRIADKLGIHSSDDKDKAQDHSSKTDRLSSKHTDTKNERDNDPNHSDADSPGFFDKIKSKLGIKSDEKTDKKDSTDDMDENSPNSHNPQGIIEVGTFPIFPGELTSIPTVDEDEVPDSPLSTDNVKTKVDSDKSDDLSKKDEASDPLRVSLPAEAQVTEEEQLQKKPQATKKVSFSSKERDHETFDEFPATKPGHKHVAHQTRPSDPPDQDLSTIVPISTPQTDAGSVYSSSLLDYNTGEIVTGNHNNQEGHHTLTTHRSDPTNNATGRSVTEVAL